VKRGIGDEDGGEGGNMVRAAGQNIVKCLCRSGDAGWTWLAIKLLLDRSVCHIGGYCVAQHA
jgi:hypothetical protein